MIEFKDNFSGHSNIYARYRPHYPESLFRFLSSLTTEHQQVWDCGTGNGQAAIDLVKYYKSVLATDPSAEQIRNAVSVPGVIYKVEKAETCSLPSASADLVTVANALHWFDFDEFYTEVRRVLKPNGVIAAWAYGVALISPEIDIIVNQFHDVTLGEMWKPENRLVEKEYVAVPFPFEIIEAPVFYAVQQMDFMQFTGYLETWSAVQRYTRERGINPMIKLRSDLSEYWQNPNEIREVKWKLILKVGRV